MDLALTRDVPKAAVYLHFYRLKITRKHIDSFMELRDIFEAFEAFEAHATYVPPQYFPGFTRLAPEVREQIIHEYLLGEREASRLSKHCHYEKLGSRCCVWEYPDVLIACDNQDTRTFPPPETGLALRGWPPELAFAANNAMLEEVVEIMLRKTECFDMKYDQNVPHLKIATWLQKFITGLPKNDGVIAIKYLCFPHMHFYNSLQPFALTNPSLELMAACKNLRNVDMTFSHAIWRVADSALGYTMRPRTVLELVSFFQIWPIFKCENLKEIHFDGIYAAPVRGGSLADLVALEDPANWLKKGFLV